VICKANQRVKLTFRAAGASSRAAEFNALDAMKIFSFLVIATVFTACNLRRNGVSLDLPSSDQVVRIKVNASTSESTSSEHEQLVTDRQKISQIMQFLAAKNGEWKQPWDTFPTPKANITIVTKDREIYFWLGGNWLGSRSPKTNWQQMRILNESEVKELEKLCGMHGV
jgi:hypothetical protein